MKIITTIVTVGIVCMFSAATATAADNDPGIQQREINQQNRINQGIQSGQLTPGEAGKLEAQQARIKQREDRMAARNNGDLTAKDKVKLARQQNRASGKIYNKKHNARAVAVDK